MSQPPSTESTESTESTDESTPDEEVPVACTLGQDDGQVRMRRWRALGAAADPRAQRSGHRLEMRYAPGPGIREELERLAAAERQCCSFVTWEVRLDGEHPTLYVSADPQRADDIAPIAALCGAGPPELSSPTRSARES